MTSQIHLLLILSLTLPIPLALADNAEDEQMIRQSAAKYAESFNRGDVDALVGQFTKDAEYDEGNGDLVKGRDAIRKKLEQEIAERAGGKMSIDIKSIRFSKHRAIEVGEATMTPKEGDATMVPYRAIHARQPDGKWLMSSVGPDVASANATSAGPLQELAWLIGNWRDDEKDVDVSSSCTWTANHRFLLRSYTVKDNDDSELKISEVIGWDPADQIYRSWVFDSDGGFGQNTWKQRGDDWIISARGTLADGGRASAVNIIHQIDDNSYTWSSTNREVDGEMLPDVDDIKMVRTPDTQPSADASDGRQP